MKSNQSIISYEKLLSSLLNTNIIDYAEVSRYFLYLIKDIYLSEKLIKHNIEYLLYYKCNILYYILLFFQINKYPELSVQALKLELPMLKNHFNSQSLKEAVENMINVKYCLKELLVGM